MTLNKAIEAAKSGLWKHFEPTFDSWNYHQRDILSDKDFWVALSIYKKWNLPIWKCENYNPKANEPGEMGCSSLHCEYAGWKDWKKLWHEAIDIVIDGGNLEKFFNEIL